MNKENNRGAAGLRRSAVAERIRIREEWSALKETDSQTQTRPANNTAGTKRTVKTKPLQSVPEKRCNLLSPTGAVNEVLAGVVALVEVGSEARALPLRAALTALGASVLPAWSPLVTHLVWAQGGSSSVRSRCRALACGVVSPLWVEGCAGARRRLPERAFPAPPRPSDLPSPATLTRMLKKAEQENIPIMDLLSESDDKEQRMPRLRLSSETDRDTSNDTSRDTSNDTSHNTSKNTSRATVTREVSRNTSNDTSRNTSNDTSRNTSKNTSRDTSKDTSRDTSNDTSDTTRDSTAATSKTKDANKSDDTAEVESRVNTAPRRALPKVSESTSPRPPQPPGRSKRKLFTHREEQMNNNDEESQPNRTRNPAELRRDPRELRRNPRELLSAERLAKRLLAACNNKQRLQANSNKYCFRIVLSGMCRDTRRSAAEAVRKLGGKVQAAVDRRTTHVILGDCKKRDMDAAPARPRTLASLEGAARGCLVVEARWAAHSAQQARWLHHTGYEIQHLRKIVTKARVERIALNLQRAEYAYDVFNGMRVALTADAEQRDAAIKLLKLCGAVVVDNPTKLPQTQPLPSTRPMTLTLSNFLARNKQNGGDNGPLWNVNYCNDREYDVLIGGKNGEVSSKWVFDSVAAARMRTTRRYVINSMSNSDVASQMLE